MMAPDVARIAAQQLIEGQSARAVALMKAHGPGSPDNRALCALAWQDLSTLAGVTTTDVVTLMRSIQTDNQVAPTITRQAQLIHQVIVAAYVMGRKAGAAQGAVPTQ